MLTSCMLRELRVIGVADTKRRKKTHQLPQDLVNSHMMKQYGKMVEDEYFSNSILWIAFF